MSLSIEIRIDIVWIININYGISRTNEVYNLKTSKKLKQTMVNSTIGYYLNGKFKSLKYIRENCIKYKKEPLPF